MVGEVIQMKVTKLIEFPTVRQSKAGLCGPAVVQSVLHFYGIPMREDEVVKALGIKENSIKRCGVSPTQIASLLASKGLRATPQHNTSVEQVKRYLDKDVPVIVAIQAWSEKPVDYETDNSNGHYVVAIGYNDGNIVFEDPSILANRGYLPIPELLKRWHDTCEGKAFDRIAIPVRGTKKFRRTTLKYIK